MPELVLDFNYARELDPAAGRPAGLLKTRANPLCVACAKRGEMLYDGLTDNLFGVPGEWSMRRCADDACGMIWLDPVPLEDDIGRAYTNYYTHRAGEFRGTLRNLRDRISYGIHRAHVSRRFGDMGRRRSWSAMLTWLALGPYPPTRMEVEFPMRYLPRPMTGRVLELGFGHGILLDNLIRLGWAAEGLEIDPVVVEAAAQRGLKVRCGTVADQGYPESSFDAVVSSHVLEHIYDPKALLRECWRILRPGGRLVAATPNARGLSHRVFGRAWRGLEPPRHLQVFTPSALRAIARSAGFEQTQTIASVRGTAGAWELSKLLARCRPADDAAAAAAATRPRWRGTAVELFEYLMRPITPDLTDEIIMVASRYVQQQ